MVNPIRYSPYFVLYLAMGVRIALANGAIRAAMGRVIPCDSQSPKVIYPSAQSEENVASIISKATFISGLNYLLKRILYSYHCYAIGSARCSDSLMIIYLTLTSLLR